MPISNSASGVKAGTIADFAGATAPDGWLVADGSAISRATYAGLFNYIGTTHGIGDGSTTFNIPDCRGEFRRGLDNGRGVDSGRTLGSAQLDDFKSHRHTLYAMSGAGSLFTISSLQRLSATQALDAGNIDLTGGTETRPRNKAYLTCIKY